MQSTVRLAVKHQVSIGAHLGYPDLLGFGQRSMNLSAHELTAIIQYQIGALQAICVGEHSQLEYVKPQGALCDDILSNLTIFRVLCHALAPFGGKLPILLQTMPGPSAFQSIAAESGITLWHEIFVDRAYQSNGLLVPLGHQKAIIDDPQAVLERCLQLLSGQPMLSNSGMPLLLKGDSLCVRVDNFAAVSLLHKIRRLLDSLPRTGC